MNRAQLRMAVASVLAALLISTGSVYGKPIVKFVSPVDEDPKTALDQDTPTDTGGVTPERTLETPTAPDGPTRTSDRHPTNPSLRQSLIRLIAPFESAPEQSAETPPADAVEMRTESPQVSVANLPVTALPSSRRQLEPVPRRALAEVDEKTNRIPLSVFIKTNRKADEIAVTPAPIPTPNAAVSPPVVRQAPAPEPAPAEETTPTVSRNVLRSDTDNSAPPLRETETTTNKTPSASVPSHPDTASNKARLPARSVPSPLRTKPRADTDDNREALRDLIRTPPTASKSPNRMASQNTTAAFSQPPKPALSRPPASQPQAVVRAAATSALIPGSADKLNSGLVEQIIGQPSLIAFVNSQPETVPLAEGAVHLTAAQEARDEDDFEDGLTAIDRVTVNVSPTEGELPPDYASAKFAKSGEIFQRMGATRHWMMYEFNWEASALATRPLYFEDVNLERYGYSYGLLLGPVVSAGNFFLRVPFIPYMRGAQPPFKLVYTLGYGRPGTYFPYHLHRPPVSLRGAAQQAAWVVGLYYALP